LPAVLPAANALATASKQSRGVITICKKTTLSSKLRGKEGGDKRKNYTYTEAS
jgi:hypothetical protein